MKHIRNLVRYVLDKLNGLIKIDLKERWLALGFIARRISLSKIGHYRPIEKVLVKSYNKYRNRNKQYLICHAPFKNLYFQMDGNVLACCNNRFYSLGKYPENSLTDIWEGEKLKKLRNHIVYNDLSLGCNFCYSCIKSNNYRGMPAPAFDGFNIKKDHPISLELELDNTCNLECIMCSGHLSFLIRKNRDKLPPIPKIYDDNFVESLKAIIPGLKRVKFIGGEPFLIEIYYKIWESILEINPQCIIELQTNATTLNDRIKDLLNRGNFRIGVSLDSLQKVTYEKIRVNANFENVMKNILYFSDYSKKAGYALSVSVCPMRINWEEIPDLINFCNDLGADIYFNTVVYPNHLAIWNLNSLKIKEIQEYYKNVVLKKQGSMSLLNYERFKHLENQINLWYDGAIKRESDIVFYKTNDVKLNQGELIKKLQNYIAKDVNGINSKIDLEMVNNNLNTILSKVESEKSKNTMILTLYNLPVDLVYDLLTNDSYGLMKSILHEYIEQNNKDESVWYDILYQA